MIQYMAYIFLIVLSGVFGHSAIADLSQEGAIDVYQLRNQIDQTEDLLLKISDDARVVSGQLRKIDDLPVDGKPAASRDAAIQLAASAQEKMSSLAKTTNEAIEYQRIVQRQLSTDRSGDKDQLLKEIDLALEPSIAISLGVASLTLSGLLLGLGLPLLLSTLTIGSNPGADRPNRAFRLKMARAASKVLLAFVFFAAVILENISLDPIDWDLFNNEMIGMWADVGFEVCFLGVGIILLAQAARMLYRGVVDLANMWERV